MSKVYLAAGTSRDRPDKVARDIEALWRHAGFDQVFGRGDLAALKLHVGEPGTRTFVPPPVAAALVRLLVGVGARPFLTDTVVLYRSPRDNAVSHAAVARDHGFSFAAVGAPFIGADGLNGSDEVEVPIAGKHFTSVAIASAILHCRSMLVLSHLTGHLGTGIAAALKSLGMGCCSKKAKLRQHHGQSPRIDPEECTGCGTCASWCPSDAIEVAETAVIDSEKCIGCGECVAVCRDGGVGFDWRIMGAELQERIVEHAAAVTRRKPGRIGYVTVAENVTKNCDCLGLDERPLFEDIGILASQDPVAIDQAALDLVRRQAGQSLESMSFPKQDGTVQIRYAEQLGLGTSRYELVAVRS
jgi:uncharacterized Fe-S center protein